MLKNGGDLKHIILFSIERMKEKPGAGVMVEETMKKLLKIFFVKRFQK